jgi:probable HAF family extracellular repeat protein
LKELSLNPEQTGHLNVISTPLKSSFHCRKFGLQDNCTGPLERNMKSKMMVLIGVPVLMAVLTIQLGVSAYGNGQVAHHRQYKLFVLGPLGGPTSGSGGIGDGGLGSGIPGAMGSLSDQGVALVAADTAAPDPFNPGFNIFHAYKWYSGDVTHLDTLPVLLGSAGNNSYPNAVNEWGFIVGWSANGVIDPLVGGPEINAVLWTPAGRVINLGTMGGFQSEAMLINDAGQVAGWFENTTPDPFSFGAGAETQPFLWQDGVMRPLGTLTGGTDALPFALNERGQVVGCSSTSTTLNIHGFVSFDPFIWEKGKMTDVGSLGGLGGCAASINNRGQVVGYSDLEGDTQQHAFLWEKGTITDLSTLGGSSGGANVINDGGEIAGFAFLTGDQAFHATIWTNGVITDLQTVDGNPCSVALDMNSQEQVVGSSGDCDLVSNQHAFLWENGGIVDLNTLVPAGSGLQLQFAFQINKRGEIAGFGALANGDPRAFVLIPRDADDDSEETINAGGSNNPGARAAPQAAARPSEAAAPTNAAAAWRRARMALRFGRLGSLASR